MQQEPRVKSNPGGSPYTGAMGTVRLNHATRYFYLAFCADELELGLRINCL